MYFSISNDNSYVLCWISFIHIQLNEKMIFFCDPRIFSFMYLTLFCVYVDRQALTYDSYIYI